MKALRKIRIDNKYSLRQLENASKVPMSTIRDYEIGNIKKLNDKALKNIAKALDTTVEEISKDLIEKEKHCMNEICLLNKKGYCQSEHVINGYFCKNENLVTKK